MGYEVLGENLPLDCRLYVTITWCLNCNEPIRNDRNRYKEYCCKECRDEHEQIMKYAIEG